MSEHPKGPKKAIVFSLLVILVAVALWHFFFPLLGIAIGVTALVWGVMIGSVVFLVALTLLFFLFTGAGIIVLSIFGVIGFIIAIVIAPILFPFLLPLFVLMLFIAFMRRRRR